MAAPCGDGCQTHTDRKRLQIEFLQLKEPFLRQTVQLQRHSNTIARLTTHQYRVTFSPDLLLAAIDDLCYRLPNNIETAAAIILPIHRRRHHSVSSPAYNVSLHDRHHVQTGFSTCHRYMSETDPGSFQPPRRPSLDLYELDLGQNQAFNREISGQLSISKFSWLASTFHPTMPILAVVAVQSVHGLVTSGYHGRFICYMMMLEEQKGFWTKLEEIYTKKLTGELTKGSMRWRSKCGHQLTS